MLDEDFSLDAQSHTVDLCNIVIVLISNLGADILLNADSTHQDSFEVSPSTNEVVMTAVGSTFLPRFNNRLDKVIDFRRLSKSALTDIVNVRLNELKASLEDHRALCSELTMTSSLVGRKCKWPKVWGQVWGQAFESSYLQADCNRSG